MQNGIPMRQFGRHDVHISALGSGGHHLGDAQDVSTAIRMVREAVDNGVTFFDSCWEYHRGKSEDLDGPRPERHSRPSFSYDQSLYAWA